MSVAILNFLQTGKLGLLEVGMSLESALAAVPGLLFSRENAGLRVYDTGGDLQLLAFEDDRVCGIILHLADKELNLPLELGLGEWTLPRSKRSFMKLLDRNKLEYTRHLDVFGRPIGVRLQSGVVVKFDGGKLYSMLRDTYSDDIEPKA